MTKTEYMRVWRRANPERVAAVAKARRDANPEKFRARSRAWYHANKERAMATSRAWHEAHPDYSVAKVIEWGKAHPERRAELSRDHTHRRRAVAAGVVMVRVASDVCGVCRGPLDPGARYPDRMATSVGHEPPLSRCRPGDRVAERPEHWGCNLRKGTRTDRELHI